MVTLGEIKRALSDEGLAVPYITLYSWARRGLLGTPVSTKASGRGVERFFDDSALRAARMLAEGLRARNAKSGGRELCTVRQARKRLLAIGIDVSVVRVREAIRQHGLEVADGLIKIEDVPVLAMVFSKKEVDSNA